MSLTADARTTRTTTTAAATTTEPTATTAGDNSTKRTESDVYDRQIRLWGADAQAKMSQAKVLYIHMTGVTSEVLKNMVLAGIRPAICDSRTVDESKDFLCQTPSFFWTGSSWEDEEPATNEGSYSSNFNKNKTKRPKHGTIAELVQPAIEDLNPLLGSCELVNHSISELLADEKTIRSFSVVVASRLTPKQALELASKLLPEQKLFWVDSFGWHGSCFVDLGQSHLFRPEVGKTVLDATKLDPYIPLADMWTIPLHLAVNRFHKVTPPPSLVYHRVLLEYFDHKQQWPADVIVGIDTGDFVKYIREVWLPETSPSLLDNDLFSEMELEKLAKQALCEMIPICSVAGGMVGNEVIKAISGKGTPANNTVIFDGTTCKGWFYLLQSKKAK